MPNHKPLTDFVRHFAIVNVSFLAITAQACAGFIAYSPTDGSSQTIIRDLNTNASIGWYPDGAVSDITFNATTGDLYAATRGGIYRRNTDHTTDQLGIAGFTANAGGDIAVLGNLLAYSLNDYSTNQIVIRNLDTNSNNSWTPDGRVSDIAFDAATGHLYAATQAGIFRRNANGSSTRILSTGFSPNAGGDISVHGNLLAYSVNDFNSQILIRDLTTGQTTSWNLNGAVSDITFDAGTGDLFAATQSGIFKRTVNGSTVYLGINSFQTNAGGDIAALTFETSTVPEPGSLVLLCLGILILMCCSGKLHLRRRVGVKPT